MPPVDLIAQTKHLPQQSLRKMEAVIKGSSNLAGGSEPIGMVNSLVPPFIVEDTVVTEHASFVTDCQGLWLESILLCLKLLRGLFCSFL